SKTFSPVTGLLAGVAVPTTRCCWKRRCFLASRRSTSSTRIWWVPLYAISRNRSRGGKEGTLHAKLCKGIVLAARIAATVFQTPSAKPEALDGFATVSTYTEGDVFDLRPCEFLGVCVDVVAD
ncbi:unnamed protein product, partial [Ectocarpus sp. 13 AM-2016]